MHIPGLVHVCVCATPRGVSGETLQLLKASFSSQQFSTLTICNKATIVLFSFFLLSSFTSHLLKDPLKQSLAWAKSVIKQAEIAAFIVALNWDVVHQEPSELSRGALGNAMLCHMGRLKLGNDFWDVWFLSQWRLMWKMRWIWAPGTEHTGWETLWWPLVPDRVRGV